MDAIIAENPDKSLDDLIEEKKINNDQKAQVLKKPSLQATVAQTEEQIGPTSNLLPNTRTVWLLKRLRLSRRMRRSSKLSVITPLLMRLRPPRRHCASSSIP